MSQNKLAQILFFSYLILLIIVSGFIVLAGNKDQFLRLNNWFATFAIVVPILLTNIGIIARYLITDISKTPITTNIPIGVVIWVALLPVFLAYILIIGTLYFRGYSLKHNLDNQISIEQMNIYISLVISLLNASTLYITSYLYQKK